MKLPRITLFARRSGCAVGPQGARAWSSAGMLTVGALLVGCGGGGGTLQASLRDVDPSDGYWTIRAACAGGDLQVEFRPGGRLSVPGLGYASNEEIAVECGDPVRVAVSSSELRRRAATPTGVDLAAPSSDPVDLSCAADGSLEVEAHPVWGQNGIVGSALRVERGGHTIVTGAIARAEGGFSSELRWWRALCRRRQ